VSPSFVRLLRGSAADPAAVSAGSTVVAGQFVFARDEVERDAVARGDLPEVAVIEGGHRGDPQAFGNGDHGGSNSQDLWMKIF
jgi:hypothetical protein